MIDPIVTPRDDGDKKNLSHRLGNDLIKEFYMDQFKDMKVEDMEQEQEEANTQEKGLPCEAGDVLFFLRPLKTSVTFKSICCFLFDFLRQ